ncbi:MAG: tetratricopeptide repeat protein [Acidobacteriota bacterium]
MKRWTSGPAAIGVVLGLLVLTACTSRPPAPTAPRPSTLPSADAPFVRNPTVGYPLTADREALNTVRDAFDALRTGARPAAELDAAAAGLLEQNPGFHPARVLRAQIAFLADAVVADPSPAAQALTILQPVVDELPDYVPAQLLRGRAAARSGDVVRAYAAYQRIASSDSAAARQAYDLRDPAIDALTMRARSQVLSGRLDDAERTLAELADWAPDDVRTWSATAEIAALSGDTERELDALVTLEGLQPNDLDLKARLADRLLATNDLRGAMRRLDVLRQARPDDPALQELMEKATFRWRLEQLPEAARSLADRRELTRGEFASLLYWLVPSVRYAQVDNPPIATDILDHPRRKEIVGVVNLRLMTIDRTLHRFSPEDPISRRDAMAALLRLLLDDRPPQDCLGGAEDTLRRGSRAANRTVCAASSRCGLILEAGDCLPGLTLSSEDALDLLRRTLNRLSAS